MDSEAQDNRLNRDEIVSRLSKENDILSRDALGYIETLERALDIYKRERDRFKHNHPEITGEYFLAGGHGEVDDNLLPQYVSICPAYGVGWEQVYEKTNRTISLEGS